MNIKKIISLFLILLILINFNINVKAADLDVNEDNYCVTDMNTGRVLFGKNIDKKVYPASTTKILTAMVAYDHLDEKLPITVVSEVLNAPEGSSVSEFKLGESFSRADIIRGLMIPSGNDMGILIAVTVARRDNNDKKLSYDECIKYFAKLMNDKAKSYGVKNSNFVNPHGFYEDNHYTTPNDMNLIALHIKDYPELEEIVKEREYTIKAQDGTGLVTNEYHLYSHNEFLVKNGVSYEYATGIKTGYTEESGYCLVASAKKDKREILISIFGAKDGDIRALDAGKISDYVFENYTESIDIKKGDNIDSVKLIGTSKFGDDSIYINSDENLYIYLNKNEKLRYEYKFNDEYIKNTNEGLEVEKDIPRNTNMGECTVYINDKPVKTLKIFNSNELNKRTLLNSLEYFLYMNKLKLVLSTVVLLIALLGVFLICKITHKKAR